MAIRSCKVAIVMSRSWKIAPDKLPFVEKAMKNAELVTAKLIVKKMQAVAPNTAWVSPRTVSRFLEGKPVAKESFLIICKTLSLDADQIREHSSIGKNDSLHATSYQSLIDSPNSTFRLPLKSNNSTYEGIDLSNLLKPYASSHSDQGNGFNCLKSEVVPSLNGENDSSIPARNIFRRSPIMDISPQTDFSEPSYPGLPLHPNSPFQVVDKKAERRCIKILKRPGGVLRIRASKNCGKTTLLRRLIYQLTQEEPILPANNIVYIDFKEDFNEPLVDSLNHHVKFLAFVGETINHYLGGLLPSPQITGYTQARTELYQYLDRILAITDSPIIIALDNLEELLKHPEEVVRDYDDFFKSFSDKIRHHSWSRFRLISITSTNEYVASHFSASPFNVGEPVVLNRLTVEEIKQLITTYQFPDVTLNYAEKMLSLFGGFHYLTQKALYFAQAQEMPLSEFLEDSYNLSRLFKNEFKELLENIQNVNRQSLNLEENLKKIIKSEQPIWIDDDAACMLEAVGVITLARSKAVISCELYHSYFERRFRQPLN